MPWVLRKRKSKTKRRGFSISKPGYMPIRKKRRRAFKYKMRPRKWKVRSLKWINNSSKFSVGDLVSVRYGPNRSKIVTVTTEIYSQKCKKRKEPLITHWLYDDILDDYISEREDNLILYMTKL